MSKITYCIPSKNNLRYLKHSIQSIKENSSIDYDIIVFIDGDNDGTEHWCKENNITYLLNTSEKPKGIAYAYNRCIEVAATDIVCMFHADMYMAKGFDVNCLKHLQEKTVISGTRIEPPLHPPGLEKIIKNFGMYPEDFTRKEFDEFVESIKKQQKNQVTYGIFAPWLCFKSELSEIGMHDESFHSYHEDSDIFNRMILNGMKCIQSRDALVYHLTCRGGQFQDGIEQITKNAEFHSMKHRAIRNYLRKWGSWIKNDEYQHPIIPHKYDIHAIIHNCNYQILELLEPWFSGIHTKITYGFNWAEYRDMEQEHTSFDLSKRLFDFNPETFSMDNIDILVEFDAKLFTQQTFNIIENLSDIITQTNETGEFEIDCLKITITNLRTYENELIKL